MSAAGREETGTVTWRTAAAALLGTIALTAAAVGGFLLAGRAGGLARADRVLAMLPEGVVGVALVELAELRERVEVLREVDPSLEDRLRALDLPGEEIHRAILFAHRGRVGAVFEGNLRARDLRGSVIGQHQGVDLRRAGSLVAATLREGRAIVGSRGTVAAVLDVARGNAPALPASPAFAALRDLAVRGRGHAFAQVVLLPGAGSRLADLGAVWPAIRSASAAGLFARARDGEAEVIVLASGASPVLARAEGELRDLVAGRRGTFPLASLLSPLEIEREEGSLRARAAGSPAWLGKVLGEIFRLGTARAGKAPSG